MWALADEFQLELIDLRCSTEFSAEFGMMKLYEFYTYVPTKKYTNIHKNAIYILPMFAGTYVCEQYFARMIHSKSESGFRLTQAHLSETSKVATTWLKIDMKDLVKAVAQCIGSTTSRK